MSSADFVHLKGLGSSLCFSMKARISASSWRVPDIDAGGYRILSWDMEPGDALAFHAMTVHGAGGNLTTDVRRRGYAVRYCGEGCTYFAGPGPNRDLRNPALADGDPLNSAQYPVVWP